MGNNKRIVEQKEVPKPVFNERFTVELCENVHLHYRNVRLEFPKDEFLFIIKLLKGLDEKTINDFVYGENSFKELINVNDLPPSTEFDNRLQIEEQVNGIFHVHYRNLRLELSDLNELGIK